MTYRVSGIGGSTYTGTSFSDADYKRAMGDMRTTMSHLSSVARDMQTSSSSFSSSSSLSSRSVESSRYVPYCSGGMSFYSLDKAKQEYDWKQKRALNGTGEYKGMPLDLRQSHITYNNLEFTYWSIIKDGGLIEEDRSEINLLFVIRQDLGSFNSVRRKLEKQIKDQNISEQAIAIRDGMKAVKEEMKIILDQKRTLSSDLIERGEQLTVDYEKLLAKKTVLYEKYHAEYMKQLDSTCIIF